MSEKFIVITTIHNPSEGIALFRDWGGWTVVVVGDRKTPADWACEGVVYLGLEEQRKMFPELSGAILENTYRRKMLGYAYAIRNGATAILESDDDNIPYPGASASVDFELAWDRKGGDRRRSSNMFLNSCELFGARDCWPRGFPIDKVRDSSIEICDGVGENPWAVMQFMVDEDPDVDAVYRMTNGRPVYFARDRKYILDPGTHCPINSQATLWTPEAFPLMFLPGGGVTDRVTDILRGYAATRCLWNAGLAVAYASPIVYQNRNHHNFLSDFAQEMELYLHASDWMWRLGLMVVGDDDMIDGYASVLTELRKMGATYLDNLPAYDLFLKAAGLK